jgi:AcrR family transcriptional regulator
VPSKTPLQAEKILTAAVRLFATHRFHEARMEDIAALAEVGKGTLYRYFKDKEELYLALLERGSAGMTLRLAEGVDRARSPREQLEAVAATVIRYFDENPYLFDLIQHAEAMRKPDHEFPWQKARDVFADLLAAIFAAAAARGDFRIDDPELAVFMFMGGLRSVIRFGHRPRRADLPRRIVAHFLAGFAHAEERVSAHRAGAAEAPWTPDWSPA